MGREKRSPGLGGRTRRRTDTVPTRLSEIEAYYASAPIGLCVFDLGLRYLRINDRMAEMNGIPAAAHIGRTVRDIVPALAEQAEAIVRRIVETGEPVKNIEFTGETTAHPGVPGFWLEQWHPIKNRRGRVIAINVAAEDITERRRMEAALRQGESRFKSLADNLPAVLMRFDGDLRVIYLSAPSEKVTGIPVAGFLGRTNRDVGMPEHLCDLWDEAIRDVFRTGENRTIEFGFPLSGEPRTFYLKFAPEFGADGRVESVLGISTDITDRIRAEEALRKAHDELEQRVRERTRELSQQAELLELAHNAVLVTDMEGRITFWNRGAEEVYGWTRAEAVGAVVGQLLRTMTPVSGGDARATLMREGRWDGELGHTTKDGRTITVLSRQALQRDEFGNPAAVMEINLDITAARLTEERLRQAHKLEAIGTLAGGIAHDFNNILAAILSFNELSLLLAEDFRLRSYLKRAIEATLRGRDLVRQITAFSRKSDRTRKPLRLIPLVHETFQLLRATLPATIDLRLETAAGRDVVNGDATDLQQVLLNIANNAAQAMPGGGTLSLSVAESRADPGRLSPHYDPEGPECLVLTVTDTGSGMDDEVKSRVFEPFFSTKPAGRNAGLGLSVAYGIVKAHQGDITVDSRPGQGSVFRVCLPLSTGEIETAPIAAAAAPGGTEHLLFVDDEASLTVSAAEILKSFGYAVTTAVRPDQAIELFLKEPHAYDLVITDQVMPGLTGMALARKLLHIRPDLPIILTTGYSENASPEKARKLGIRRLLVKPLTMRQLAEAVRQVLDEDPVQRTAEGGRLAVAEDRDPQS